MISLTYAKDMLYPSLRELRAQDCYMGIDPICDEIQVVILSGKRVAVGIIERTQVESGAFKAKWCPFLFRLRTLLYGVGGTLRMSDV